MNYANYNHITTNSKKVKEGSIFISIDLNVEHISEAINNKAALIISEKKINDNINNIVVKNIKYYYTYLFKKIHQLNLDNFKIILK